MSLCVGFNGDEVTCWSWLGYYRRLEKSHNWKLRQMLYLKHLLQIEPFSHWSPEVQFNAMIAIIFFTLWIVLTLSNIAEFTSFTLTFNKMIKNFEEACHLLLVLFSRNDNKFTRNNELLFFSKPSRKVRRRLLTKKERKAKSLNKIKTNVKMILATE